MALDTVAAGRTWVYSHNIGRRAAAGMGFNWPTNVALGKDNRLFVANRTPHISRLTGDQQFLGECGRAGQPGGDFVYLSALAVDQDENVYAADEWLNEIRIFDVEGNFLRTWGEAGDGEGQLIGPSGMVFDSEDNLWIVSSMNSGIQKFDKDGKYLEGFGIKGNADGELDHPWGITVDNAGDIYIADWNNHLVKKFTTQGILPRIFGSGKPTGVSSTGSTVYEHTLVEDIGVDPNDLNHPSGVAVDGDGDVYVTDWMNERVVIFDAEASTLTTLRGDAHELSEWAQLSMQANPDMLRRRRQAKHPEVSNWFRMPAHCVFDQATNRLIVCDTMRHRLQIYEKDNNYADP